MPGLEPGNPDAFLESATVFWDYFLYGDTLRIINDARRKFSNPALFAYEAGAVYEGQRDYRRASRFSTSSCESVPCSLASSRPCRTLSRT